MTKDEERLFPVMGGDGWGEMAGGVGGGGTIVKSSKVCGESGSWVWNISMYVTEKPEYYNLCR